jgi:hypothetical protein
MNLASNQNTLHNRSNFGAFIPSFLDDYPLEPEEFRLYSHIQRRAGGQGCFESIPKMAQHCYMALKTAKNALKVLLATGMLTIQERPGTTNIYTLAPATEWVEPKQVLLLREQIKIKKESPVKNDPSQKCMGGGVNFAPPTGVKNASGVGSILTHEGIPIKDIPVKVLPPKDAPPENSPLPNHESVCENEQFDLNLQTELEESTPEEPIPQQPTSLLKNSETLQQTDNPSRGSTIAGGSFDKSEQSNKPQLTCPYKTARNVKELIDAWLTDPTAMSDDCVPLLVRDSIKWNCWVLPWRNAERKLNNLYQNFNPIVVDFLAKELATKSKLSAQQEITHAVAVMNTWEKNKGGWTNLMQRYHQAVLQTEKQPLSQLHTATPKRPNTSTTLEDALLQDQIRRQQEKLKQEPSLEYQKSPQMLQLKAKLQAKANEPKVSSNSKLSSRNLREVEAQLKLALRA